jgi:hypothetical protein
MAEAVAEPQFEAQTKMAAELEKLYGKGAPIPGRGGDTGPMITPAGVVGGATGAPAVPTVTPSGEIPAAGPTGQPGPVGPTGVPAAATGAPSAATGSTGAAATGATGATGPAAELTQAEKVAAALAKAEAARNAEETDPAAAQARKAAEEAEAAEEKRKAEGRLTDAEKDAAEKNMTIKAGTAFKAVRAENAELEKKLTEANAKIAEAEKKLADASATSPDAVKELQAKVDRYEKELGALKIEATDEYQKAVTRPMAKAQADLRAIAVRNKVSEGDLAAALSEPDLGARNAKLAELTSEFNRWDLNEFDRVLTKISDINEAKANFDATAADRAKGLTAQQAADAAAAKAEIQRNWNHALVSVREKLAKEIPVFGQTGDEKWDADLKAKLDGVQNLDLSALSNEDLAAAMYRSEAVPMLLTLITDLFGQTRTLNETVTKLRGTSATPTAGKAPASEAVPKPQPQTFTEAAKEALKGILPP